MPPEPPYQRVGASADGSFELVVKAYPASLRCSLANDLRGPIAGATQLSARFCDVGVQDSRARGWKRLHGVTPMLQIIYSLARGRNGRP